MPIILCSCGAIEIELLLLLYAMEPNEDVLYGNRCTEEIEDPLEKIDVDDDCDATDPAMELIILSVPLL